MWENYDDDYESEEFDSENFDKWEVKIGRSSENFETKSDAVEYLLDEIQEMSKDKLFENAELFGFSDQDELFTSFMDMDAIQFYETLKKITTKYKIKNSIKLINLDDEQPEFGEL